MKAKSVDLDIQITLNTEAAKTVSEAECQLVRSSCLGDLLKHLLMQAETDEE